jgi:hypothetical protein
MASGCQSNISANTSRSLEGGRIVDRRLEIWPIGGFASWAWKMPYWSLGVLPRRDERFRESEVFRRVFERVVGACIEAGLVGGEGFVVDASLIEADANRQRSIPGVEWKKQIDPAAASRAVREYLATLNDAAFGAATEVQPKFVSPSDPAAQWTGALKGPAFFAYADNYLIDVQCGVIVDVQASRAIRQAEVWPRNHPTAEKTTPPRGMCFCPFV